MSNAAKPMPVYLDNQATTPVDPRVLDRMLPYFSQHFANPASIQHAAGRAVADAVEGARAEVAALLGADEREIVFTSGATEANDLAIKGAIRFARGHGRGDGIVTLATEHKCVLESAEAMRREGARVTVLPVGPDGLVDLDRLADAIDDRTVIVSVLAAHNEIGTVQPLAEIGSLCRARGVLFHTDAAQAAGKIPLDVEAMRIDLLSVSAHKLYGPKGIGCLYVRRRPRARLEAQMDGGGQERAIRSGTVASPLVVGFGAAAAIARRELADEAPRLAALNARFLARLRTALPDVTVNGHPARRLAGNLNLAIPGVPAAELVLALSEDVALSTGSACTSAEVEPSYVLRAIGLDEATAKASFRVAVGRFTVEAEVDYAADRIAATAAALRRGGAGVSRDVRAAAAG